uniref:RsmF rRNA methyltransferase first C-terminal domain-containing protein n=1 Tax=Enterococcus faecium TaxID=1352 RepID=UPI0029301255
DHLWEVPELAPSLDGLKVVRTGLHLGDFKKNRFEPSYALALAILSFKIYAPQEYLSRAYNDAPKYCANIVDTQLKNNEVILSGEI